MPVTPPRSRPHARSNFELLGWLFMRWSGAVLLIMIFTHLFVNLVLGDGINQIDFAFVAGKWAHPFWQWFDLIMLWLAMLHGTNGLRVIINDYTDTAWMRLCLKSVLLTCTGVIIALGSLVIFTFDPCPPGASDDALPAWCPTGPP
ncbi:MULTISPECIES: succinate dehydrogenase hydrophobic membrane anchor subunit [unclassified Arthrobacter]|uniref:succinate dehydrogenase hydrophobic membrane anchor subunit n=1 Tax=unclassified Arthrobacter TaxID=235627 RepID=UPI00054D2AFB|nr:MULTISPECIES: succinate dehydrogenase hydrophobic membrane anchor subunit [unclassified Arthrobacter]MBE0011540.1 succinate dehydrogenase [Arthrobacter sp. AET 35A]PVE14765.1 succinate dehydrogenase [Arthrobacter sp. Bz4]